jgi:hypothetical protein
MAVLVASLHHGEVTDKTMGPVETRRNDPLSFRRNESSFPVQRRGSNSTVEDAQFVKPRRKPPLVICAVGARSWRSAVAVLCRWMCAVARVDGRRRDVQADLVQFASSRCRRPSRLTRRTKVLSKADGSVNPRGFGRTSGDTRG